MRCRFVIESGREGFKPQKCSNVLVCRDAKFSRFNIGMPQALRQGAVVCKRRILFDEVCADSLHIAARINLCKGSDLLFGKFKHEALPPSVPH